MGLIDNVQLCNVSNGEEGITPKPRRTYWDLRNIWLSFQYCISFSWVFFVYAFVIYVKPLYWLLLSFRHFAGSSFGLMASFAVSCYSVPSSIRCQVWICSQFCIYGLETQRWSKGRVARWFTDTTSRQLGLVQQQGGMISTAPYNYCFRCLASPSSASWTFSAH